MSKKQIIGLSGAILLFIGVFLPIITMPFAGQLNYFSNGKGDGVIVLFLAVLSVVLILMNKYKGLWFTGLGSLGVMIFTYCNLQSRISEMKSQYSLDPAYSLYGGLMDAFFKTVQFQWGWAVLVIGAVMVLASIFVQDEGSGIPGYARNRKDAEHVASSKPYLD